MAFRRKISSEARKDLLKLVNNSGFGFELSENDLITAEKLFCDVEKKIMGRIAGDIEDYVYSFLILRFLARWLQNKQFKVSDFCLIEIGALFGGSTILFKKALELEGCELPIYTIDPLNGYYAHKKKSYSSENDLSTGLPVDVPTLKKNFEKFGYDTDVINIIMGLSEDKEVLTRLADKKVVFCFVDGDHSREGIANDLKNYVPLLVEGGIMAIDNFVDVNWPDVTREVVSGPILNENSVIGFYNRTIFLRKGKINENDVLNSENIKRLGLKFLESWGVGNNSNDDIKGKISTTKESVKFDKNQVESVSDLTILNKIKNEIKKSVATELEKFDSLGRSIAYNDSELQIKLANLENLVNKKEEKNLEAIQQMIESIGKQKSDIASCFISLSELLEKSNDAMDRFIRGQEEGYGKLLTSIEGLDTFMKSLSVNIIDSIDQGFSKALNSMNSDLEQIKECLVRKLTEGDIQSIRRVDESVSQTFGNMLNRMDTFSRKLENRDRKIDNDFENITDRLQVIQRGLGDLRDELNNIKKPWYKKIFDSE